MADLQLYSEVPTEITLLVWRHAINAAGVQHFRISMTVQDRILRVKPWEQNGPIVNSTWRQRWNISRIDQNAWEEYDKWVTETKQRGALWIAPVSAKPGANQIHLNRAKVDAKQDLVMLTFTGGYLNLDLLDVSMNKLQFRRLERIGVNWKQTETGKDWAIEPFKCICCHRTHKKLPHCPVRIVQFLRLFPDIKHFYFVFRINGTDIAVSETESRGRGNNAKPDKAVPSKKGAIIGGRVTKPKPKKRTAEQKIEGALSAFRAIAEKKNLKIWSDCERSYYEVKMDNLKVLTAYGDIEKSMKLLKEEWLAEESPEFSPREKQQFAETEFHFVVCRERLSRKK